MKNSIIVKFVAVLLCAASLLGILGGAAGALVLAERDLYNKTVDEMLDEKLRTDAAVFAEHTALSYASRELGGCPESMAQSRYGTPIASSYGYSILDSDGKVLIEYRSELKDSEEVYTVPVTGQYMHLVSVETDSQRKANETAARMESIRRGMKDSDGQAIPAGGITVNQVIFTNREGAPIYEAYSDGTSSHSIFYYGDDGGTRSDELFDHGPKEYVGFLYYGIDGQIMYRSFLEEGMQDFSSGEIYGVMFLSHDSAFTFQTDSSEILGLLSYENGHLIFTGYPEEEVPEETVPEETVPEETVPETTAETLPPETVPETQAVEETYTEATEEWVEESEEWSEEDEEWSDGEEYQEDSSASAVPEDEGYAEEAYSEEYDSGEAYSDEESVEAETEAPTEAPVAETEPPATEPVETMPEETVVEETIPEATEPFRINGKPLEFYQVNRYDYYDSSVREHATAKYVYLSLPEMTAEVYVDRDTIANAQLYQVLRMVRQYRDYLLPVIGISLLVFAMTIVYLCTAAGRKPNCEEVRAGGLNRLPLDLYLGIGIFAGAGFIALVFVAFEELLERDFLLGCSVAVASGFGCCLLLAGFLFALIAQIKTPGGYWWRNLLCIRFVFLCMRFMQWLEQKLRSISFPWLSRILKKSWAKIWKFLVWLYEAIERLTAHTGKLLNHFFSLMPLMWQWVVCGMLLFCLLLIACNTHSELLTFICLTAALVLIFYGAHCFGTLLESTRKMGRGELNIKVEDKHMVGCFKEFAGDLNDLADVTVEAARKQLKSERMKTELITNVSHDIKTPLTSIINYVDLLQKPHTDEETAQYLEVLDRQSQRLKKLVEDLMDMSKASTGNMTVEITQVDAVESVNQALGEFADKLERARLYPVFRHTEDSVPMMADGKLVWRVLSNLLGNTVKYAMPGTRVYLDLTRVGGNVVISLKNISRDELNVDAEELMERFVRGDVSRNTEGSGLGLNIAKSLMELQKGQLQILVDGDLFKVTLIFPTAE